MHWVLQTLIKNALTVYPENADLLELQAQIEKDTPTYFLNECTPYAKEDYKEYVNGKTVTMAGNTYTDGFTLYYDGYAIYNIDSAYSSIRFTLGHCDGTRMENATIKVYCDGILKEEVAISAEDLPKKFTLDITGVDQLKFEIKSYQGTYAIANITVK